MLIVLITFEEIPGSRENAIENRKDDCDHWTFWLCPGILGIPGKISTCHGLSNKRRVDTNSSLLVIKSSSPISGIPEGLKSTTCGRGKCFVMLVVIHTLSAFHIYIQKKL